MLEDNGMCQYNEPSLSRFKVLTKKTLYSNMAHKASYCLYLLSCLQNKIGKRNLNGWINRCIIMPFTTLYKNIDFEEVAFTSFYLLTIDKISLNQIKKIKLHNIKLEKLSFVFLRNMRQNQTMRLNLQKRSSLLKVLISSKYSPLLNVENRNIFTALKGPRVFMGIGRGNYRAGVASEKRLASHQMYDKMRAAKVYVASRMRLARRVLATPAIDEIRWICKIGNDFIQIKAVGTFNNRAAYELSPSLTFYDELSPSRTYVHTVVDIYYNTPINHRALGHNVTLPTCTFGDGHMWRTNL
ncbi:hypothetical protein AGLY_002409 [Aphis glycines]|uniref:Uncharacterized protein n=1 Tax=Aphis glycines TaxID=307491 RepID=A0A6G0U4R0_APHGL|nr:hypothetical protein AGLY_002409 [Aphis glycines]